MKCLIQEYDQIVHLRPKETLTRSDIWREVETIIKRLLGRMRRLSPRASVRFANDAAAEFLRHWELPLVRETDRSLGPQPSLAEEKSDAAAAAEKKKNPDSLSHGKQIPHQTSPAR